MASGELRALVDKQAIHEVVLRYCRGVDRFDLGLVRSCYWPDASEEHGSFTGGLEEFLRWLERVLRRYETTMHMVANHLADMHGDVAGAETYGIAYHRGDPADPADPTRNLTVGFRYLDRFERREGTWRIARRVAVTEWVRQEDPGSWWPIPEGMRTGRRDTGDLVYQLLPDPLQ